MKYKVIGWTYYDNMEFIDKRGTVGFAERNAIIDEIKKHKYLFSGWHHQESWENCVPILNDGQTRTFSQRGWGGIMAEAYGYFGDYDYASFTFHQSIDKKDLRFPKNEFEKEDFVSEPLKNEHFDVEVSEGLFNIAKKKNPFFLEDIDSLRYIDENDTITLHYNGEELTFLVDDVDRNKKEIKFKDHHLINGKYKVIIKHKPFGKKIIERTPLMIEEQDVPLLFDEVKNKYDFNLLHELLITFELNTITRDKEDKKTIDVLKRFVEEYSQMYFDEFIMIRLLKYIDDFFLFNRVAYDSIKQYPNIIKQFICFYEKQNINMDQHIAYIANRLPIDPFSSSQLLLKAIELKENNTKLIKNYYKGSRFNGHLGFIAMMAKSMFDGLNKNDKLLINLNEYKKMSGYYVELFTKLICYENEAIFKDKKLKDSISPFNKSDNKIIKKGLANYKEYIYNNFDLDNLFEDILLHGIEETYKNLDEHDYDYDRLVKYIYTLDALTDFKYDLKNKSIKLYKKEYPDFVLKIRKHYGRRKKKC